jgi:hypothetical protein
VAAWDSPLDTEEARGVGAEGFSCSVENDTTLQGSFTDAVIEAIKNSKIDMELRVKEKIGHDTLLAGTKAFSESKILVSPIVYEYTTGVVHVSQQENVYGIMPDFALSVSATKAPSRVDYLPPDDEQLRKYENTVPKEIENNLSKIIGKKVRCDTPFD